MSNKLSARFFNAEEVLVVQKVCKQLGTTTSALLRVATITYINQIMEDAKNARVTQPDTTSSSVPATSSDAHADA